MVFIGTYKEADDILNNIATGTCEGRCRSVWTRNIKYALKTKTNPLKLTAIQKKNLTKKMKYLKGKRVTRKQKSV